MNTNLPQSGAASEAERDGSVTPDRAASTVPFEYSTIDPSSATRAAMVHDAAPTGRVFGDYELLEELGAGGMGVVYRARQRSAKRIVALKMIRPERLQELGAAKQKEWLDRFYAEARATGRLEHEHIVTLYEVGSLDGVAFYSMRYVEGRSLAGVLRQGPLENRRAAALMEPVARAVDHAHRSGILHRDLKPLNILVNAQDKPFVTDFGLAKWLIEGQQAVTRIGQIMGTPEYMSPEQGRDASSVTAATDIYSLGATLYDLLTGRPPFRAATPVQTLRQVIETEPVAPRQLNPAIDRDLETITLKCLQKEPARRYPDASGLADDLRRYLNHEPILARPVSTAERLWRWRRRNPRVAWLSAAVLFLLVGLAATSTVVAWQRNQQRIIAENTVKTERDLRHQADAAREQADAAATVAREQSQLALKSLRSVIFDIQRKLKNVPGARDLQRALLETALARLQEVSDQFASRGAIDRNTMVALGELGDVFLRIGSSDSPRPGTPGRGVGGEGDEGPLTAARKVYQQAFDIAQQLAAADPTDAQAQRDLSISYERLGHVLLQSGQVMEALGQYQKFLEISQKLAAADPGDAQAQRDLLASYQRLGHVLLQSGQVTEALGQYQKGLEISQKLAAADPSDAQAQRDLSVSYEKLGDVLLRSGQVTEALRQYQRALEISQQLAAADPSDAQAQSDLSYSYINLGEVLLRSGQVTEALRQYQKALEISQQLAAGDPSDAQAQRGLSISYGTLADVLFQSGQVTEALGHYQKNLEISQQLAAADPSDAQAQRHLFVSYNKLGVVLLRSGQVTEALGHNQKGLEISQRLAAGDPSDAQAQRYLSVSYNQLGDVLLQSKQVTEALGHYQKGLEISQQLAAADPSDAQAQNDLSISLERLGGISLQLGKLDDARDYFERKRQIDADLVKLDPGNAKFQRDLSVSYEKLGNINLQSGQVTEALGQYQKLLEISQALATADPSNAQAQLDLVVSLQNIASIQQQQKQFEEAIDSYGRGLKVLQSLKEQKRLPPGNAQWLPALDQFIQQCRLATMALGDWKTLLEQPAELLPVLLEMRGTEFVKEGRVNEAVRAVAKLRELGTATADQLYNAACVYSLCAAGIKPEKDELTAEQSAQRQKHIADALETLREAIKAGWMDFAHMQKDADLTVLRDLPEFKELLHKQE